MFLRTLTFFVFKSFKSTRFVCKRLKKTLNSNFQESLSLTHWGTKTWVTATIFKLTEAI